MKKALAFLLSLCLLVPCFAGCAQTDEETTTTAPKQPDDPIYSETIVATDLMAGMTA